MADGKPPPSLQATNPAAERAYVKAVRQAAKRARMAGVRPTTMLVELLVQAAAAHMLKWRDRDDFLRWAGDCYDDANAHVRKGHDH
jgi:hypothetical protein